jgi:hypothetical protein
MTPTDALAAAGFVLAVTGAAWIYPPLALVVGAVGLIALAVLTDRRTA